MQKLRALTDRLMGRVVPEVTVSAIWIDQYACNYTCGRVGWQHRRCHDGSGGCTAWNTVHCDC